MYVENESDSNNCKCDSSNLDKKTDNKNTSPVHKLYIWFTSFIIHIGYLLIYLLFIYSVIIFNNQIFNSGVFDNIISSSIKNGGYCAPFLENPEHKSLQPTIVNSEENEYSNISLFNLIKFDYVQENIGNCNNKKSENKFGITPETGDHTYGYGGVSFKKKNVNYLYYIYYNKYFNLSKCIKFIKYNDTSYAYDDNLWGTAFRHFMPFRFIWIILSLCIAVPLMFLVDTTRKFLAYNILVYTFIYKCLYNYINESLLLVILGFLFIYYPTVTIFLLLGFPFMISGITFFLVFIYNLFFQIFHYTMCSLKILNELTEETNKTYKSELSKKFFGGIIYLFKLIGTILKIIIVFFMMIQAYILLSQPIVVFVVIYTLSFLYIIIPFNFRGNILNKEKFQEFINKEKEKDKMVGGDPTTGVSNHPLSQDHHDKIAAHTTDQTTTNHLAPAQTDAATDNPGATTTAQTAAATDQTTSRDQTITTTQTPAHDRLDIDPTIPIEIVHPMNNQPAINAIAINEEYVDENEKNKTVINISSIVNDNKTEDYSIINIWKGLLYKQRYLYLMITIIFIIDLSLSEIIDKKYNYVNYLIGLVILLAMLFAGYFFNLLICKPPTEETKEPSPASMSVMRGGGYITKFFEKKTYRKNSFWIDNINNFSEKNPLTIIKDNIKVETNKCNLTIENNSYVKSFEEMFLTIFSVKEKDKNIELTQIVEHGNNSSGPSGELISKKGKS